MRKAALIVVVVILSILGIGAFTLFLLSGTAWGHERVRRFAVSAVEGVLNGKVQIGSLSGNLLNGVTLTDIAIQDSSGNPFLSAEHVSVQYSLKALLRKRIELANLTVVRPVVLLDRPPDGDWNFERIFPSDTTPGESPPGLGDWITLRDLKITDGHLLVRLPWEPDTGLTGTERDSVVTYVLRGGSRLRVVRAPGGFQQIMEFRHVSGDLPYLRLEDPDNEEILARVSSLQMEALPFNPPAARVTNARGEIHVAHDSVYWRDLRAELPESRLASINGTYELEHGDMWLSMAGERVALADLRWLYPPLPGQGSGRLLFSMLIDGDSSDFLARKAEFTSGDGRLGGSFGLAIGDSLHFHDTDLRFSAISTSLIEELVPGLVIPASGSLGGGGQLSGTLGTLEVHADVTFDDARAEGARSRLLADGRVGLRPSLSATDLQLRAMPLQVTLARAVVPDLELGGTLRGSAMLTGSPSRLLLANTDLTHEFNGSVSHITGRAELDLLGERSVDAALSLDPLSLATVGVFSPGAGLQGEARGTITARGPLRDIAVAADVTLPDGGALEIAGRADLAGREPTYDARAELRVFNAHAVLARAPRTSITAIVAARGGGISPESMNAAIALDAAASQIDSVKLDSMHARLTIADGMLDLNSLRLATDFAGIEAQGTFGLTPERHGTLTYRARVDSLQGFARWIPGSADTARVSSRPRARQRAISQARADSAALARATEVERAITGAQGPSLDVDTMATFRKDSISGSVYAAGTVRGNLAAFELRGRAAAERLVFLGNSLETARTEYALVKSDTGLPRIAAGAGMSGVSAAGFLFDSADARLTYDGGAGSVLVAVHQDGDNEYLARGNFELNLDGGVLRYSDLTLRFDTTVWVSAHPAAIHWGTRGLRVDSVELRSGDAGHILIDGEIPDEGSLALDVDITRLQLGDVSTLLQGDMDTRALLTTKARLEGTREEPRLNAVLGLTDVRYLGSPAPDIRATMQYAGGRLETSLKAGRAGAPPLAVATASLDADLSLSGDMPPLDNAPLVVDVTMDSLPLDVVPSLSSAISDLRGIMRGKLAIRGTPSAPHPVGAFSLELGSLRLTASGTRVSDVEGSITIDDDTLVIQELHGRTAGGGTIEIAGGMDITNLSAPGFDIIMDAEHALVLDNERGEVFADAGLDVRGPYDGVVVEGGIKVLSGVVYIPKPETRTAVSPSDPAVFAVLDTASEFGRELLAEQSPLLENMRLDVAVFIERGVFARSTEANLEIHTPDDPLRVSFDQRTGELRVLGTVATERGTYAVAGRRFDISHGSVLFIGTTEIDPIIQIVGEREIDLPGREALQIRVLIGGTALNPRLTLESNAQPPISQTDLLSYLAFGRSTGSLLQTSGSGLSGQGTASGQLVGSVAALATRQLAAVALGAAVQELQQDAARQIGADVFNITPADVPNELSATGVEGLLKGTEIEAGKYFSPETFVATQLRPASGQVLGLRLEQRLPKGLRIEASFEPRFLLREPTLAQQDPARPVRVIGAFLVWERRF